MLSGPTRFPPDPRLDPLRFAEPLRRPWPAWTRLAALLRDPRGLARVLAARLAGRRVRGRQLALSLTGADHALRGMPPGALLPLPAPDPAGIAVVPLPAAALPAAAILVFLAEGHELLPGALAAMARVFSERPEAQALYGDALALGPQDRPLLPLLRPAFDPDFLLETDYVGPVFAARREAVEGAGGPGDGGADLLLRIAAREGGAPVLHLPRILSTWRPFAPLGPAPEAREVRLATARRALARAAQTAEVSWEAGIVAVRRSLPEPPPLVSLIVPTRDRLDLLSTCVASLETRTDWPRREILICDNDSRDPATLAYLRAFEAAGRGRVVPWPGPFDFAGMNNRAAEEARGTVLAFVNNDVEAFRPDWLRLLCAEALRPDVGAVGAKLLDAEGRIQHGGVVLGPGGLVSHAHRFFAGDASGYLHRLRATHEVAAVTAACLVVERAKFTSVGGFDAEAFAVDFNDVDLCLRLAGAGYRTLMVPRAVLHHREAASRRWTTDARARHEREVARLRERWGERLAADRWYHPAFDPDLGTYVALRAAVPAAAR